LLLAFSSFIVALFGTLQKGPLAGVLYKETVSLRGEYWHAGWITGTANPIFGAGFDSYGDWYRRSRRESALTLPGVDTVTNTAHNVFLDIFAFGGWPLFISYILLVLIVVVSIVRFTIRNKKFDTTFVGLTSVWACYQLQSTISINQIGLAIWGWCLSGLIIGYEINTRVVPTVEEKGPKIKAGAVSQSSALTGLALFIGIAVGLTVGGPSYVASVKYKNALESQNAGEITKGAYLWPLEQLRMVEVAGAFNDQKLEKEALAITLDAVDRFPNSFYVWRALYYMKAATPEQKQEALMQMKKLDPLNPTFK
jgi:hypothetical protein